ncbi:MAG: hypothetical protein ABR911_06295 [Syntrophales bacterium]
MLRQQRQANVRQEDLPNSSVRLGLLLLAENVNQAALPQVSATQAMFQSPANVAPAVPHRAVSVNPALLPREANANLEASPEAIVWMAALLRETARREVPADKAAVPRSTQYILSLLRCHIDPFVLLRVNSGRYLLVSPLLRFLAAPSRCSGLRLTKMTIVHGNFRTVAQNT